MGAAGARGAEPWRLTLRAGGTDGEEHGRGVASAGESEAEVAPGPSPMPKAFRVRPDDLLPVPMTGVGVEQEAIASASQQPRA